MSEVKSYLGPKGYSIEKKYLSTNQQNTIRKELTVKAFAPPNSMQKPKPFTIYRESPKKLYVPRMYGIENYGEPTEIRISDGDDIDVEFKGGLRDYQTNIISKYIDESKKSGCGLLEIPCGRGKCLGYNTPVLMANRSIKNVQEIKNGDTVMGDDFTPRIVEGVTTGNDQLYMIDQSHGISYVVNEEHILTLYNCVTEEIEDIPIKDLIELKLLDERLTDRYYGIRKMISHCVLSIIDIKPIYYDTRYYGFTIGGNHRFMLGDFTLTHNTVMALNIISILKKKTLVVVHKEFLMNQWIERIQQFLPDARIGKIQGKTMDIENKDIVLGMLQSLSMKDYPEGTFNSFGLTISDECHHISAEVFCRSLFKIVTKYMLGLSATMVRKDGLSSVFKKFIGNVVYKEEREGDSSVMVKAIQYTHDDEDFSKTELNFKGQTHYAIMIRKLCLFNHRSEFILTILQDALKNEDNKQIMILAHNKSLLKYLYDAIEHRNMATVGYYVGGMKEAALKVTESKKVVIATYAMAEEALDIKSLSCLIMATPKTDVTQAVGRILRMKHVQPLVIDIVDQHGIFQRQSIKRMKFYKKCDYTIMETTYDKYFKNEWIKLYDPTCKTKKKALPNKNKGTIEDDIRTKKIEDFLDIKIKKSENIDSILTGVCLI